MEEAVWNLENGKEYVGERDEGVLGEGYYSTMWQVLVSAFTPCCWVQECCQVSNGNNNNNKGDLYKHCSMHFAKKGKYIQKDATVMRQLWTQTKTYQHTNRMTITIL